MVIKQVYIGGWFQRTTLHLSEAYDFLRQGTSSLELDKKKLLELQQNLDITAVDLIVDGMEQVQLSSRNGISLKVHEDGLVVLRRDFQQGDDLANDIKVLTEYYEHKLSPAFSYLYSLGAPVPKELANIKTVYPYFVVVEQASKAEIDQLLATFDQEKYLEVKGDKFYIIHIKHETRSHYERFIEEQIFLREFKGQLHRYLNLHRIIWERIEEVKERQKIKGGEINGFRDKVESYAKTINLIEGRINQMDTYLHTREQIVKDDNDLKDFIGLLEYRYETLGNTLEYLKDIWLMTKNYVDSALGLFGDLQSKATENSVMHLTVVTSMGVGATLIGLFTTDKIPAFTAFGVGYIAVLAMIGYFANKATGWFYRKKLYTISDVKYNKNIK
jgi:hypothetical protein